MTKDLIEVATKISTPLALAGLFAVVFFSLLRILLLKIALSRLSTTATVKFVKLVIDRLTLLSLVAMILGFIGYVVTLALGHSDVVGDREGVQSPVADLISQGRAHLKAGELGLARDAFEKSSKENPEDPAHFYWLAKVALMTGSRDTALHYLGKALSVDKSHIPSLTLQIEILLLQGGTAQAHALAERVKGTDGLLDVWIDCLQEERLFEKVVVTELEVEQLCPVHDISQD